MRRAEWQAMVDGWAAEPVDIEATEVYRYEDLQLPRAKHADDPDTQEFGNTKAA